MARIITVEHARASTKQRRCVRTGCGHVIEVGERYKHASYKTSPYSSTTRYWCKDHLTPKASETTMNERLSTLYSLQEGLEAELSNFLEETIGYDELADALESAASEAESVQAEYEESASNLEEHFSGSSQIDEINDKATAVEEWIEELNSAAQAVRDADPDLPEFDPDACEKCKADREAPEHDEESESFDHEFEEPEEPEDDRSNVESEVSNAIGALSL